MISTALGWPGSAFFVAGLIHDIGKLVMYMTFPLEFSEAADRVKRGEEKPFEAEKNAFGVTHEEVGAMLLKRWMFPENLIAAVQYHHRPRQLKGDFRFPLVVYAADVLAHLNEIAEEDQALDPGLHFFDPEVLELFQAYGLIWDDSVLERLSVNLSGQKEENAEVLNLFLS